MEVSQLSKGLLLAASPSGIDDAQSSRQFHPIITNVIKNLMIASMSLRRWHPITNLVPIEVTYNNKQMLLL